MRFPGSVLYLILSILDLCLLPFFENISVLNATTKIEALEFYSTHEREVESIFEKNSKYIQPNDKYYTSLIHRLHNW